MSKWKMPVDLMLDGTNHQTVHGPYAAAMLLMISWRAGDAPERERAERMCLEAVEGRIEVEDARKAFLAAVDEAGLTIGSSNGNSAAA